MSPRVYNLSLTPRQTEHTQRNPALMSGNVKAQVAMWSQGSWVQVLLPLFALNHSPQAPSTHSDNTERREEDSYLVLETSQIHFKFSECQYPVSLERLTQWQHLSKLNPLCISVYIYLCVCMCVCVSLSCTTHMHHILFSGCLSHWLHVGVTCRSPHKPQPKPDSECVCVCVFSKFLWDFFFFLQVLKVNCEFS